MNEIEKYKWDVYAKVAYAINKANIPHSAMHGIDYNNQLVGRDCDLLVSQENSNKVKAIIKKVFENCGGSCRFIDWSWGFGGVHFIKKNDLIYTVEIDVAWTYSYRIIELTDLSYLSFYTEEDKGKEFYIDSWNQFAKVFLLRFLSSDFSKFDGRRIEEIKDIAKRIYQPYHVLPDVMDSWVAACRNFNIENLKELRKNFSLWKYFMNHPMSSMKVLYKVVYYALMRMLKVYKVIPSLTFIGADDLFISDFEKRISGTFITKATCYYCNSKIDYWIKKLKARFFTSPFSVPIFLTGKRYSKMSIVISKDTDMNDIIDDLFENIFMK